MNSNHSLIEIPGIKLLPSTPAFSKANAMFGSFSAGFDGILCSSAKSEGWTVFLDGLLYKDQPRDISDAEIILRTFLKHQNILDIHQLDGSYNIIIIANDGRKGFLLSDPLCSRPQFIYKTDSCVACAPSPLFFAKAGLKCSLNRTALFEQFKFLHPGYNHTLCNEIERIMPGIIYEFDKQHQITHHRSLHFKQDVDHSLTKEDSSKWMYEICKTPMESVLDHPVLKDFDVHLALTSGLDSRHILGQLLELKKKPKFLRQIALNQEDYLPVKHISEELDIPLLAPTIFEIETKQLIKRWMERSGALVNVHQYYLLELMNDTPKAGCVNFNGYLMDKLLGLAPVLKPETHEDIQRILAKKSYTVDSTLHALFDDANDQKHKALQFYNQQIEQFEGEPWYRMGMHELHCRGIQYTGATDAMMPDNLFSFSPGASAKSYDFFSSVPWDIGGDKKIRLAALNSYFPNVAKFPDGDGIPFSEKKDRPRTSTSPILKNAMPFLKYIFSGFRGDPAPNTEHEWLRKSTVLKEIHRKVVFEGEILNDNILSKKTAIKSWRLHQLGGFQAWTLMSLLTAEVAYQLFIKQRSTEDISDWLGLN